jgi:hypothetical protein
MAKKASGLIRAKSQCEHPRTVPRRIIITPRHNRWAACQTQIADSAMTAKINAVISVLFSRYGGP